MFHYKLQQNDKNTSKNGEYVSILITMKHCCPMTLNDFAENQETLFYDAGIFKRHECIATNSRLNKNYLRVC